MSYTVADLYPGIQRLLVNRTVPTLSMNENIRKAVLELTEDYKHPLLEETGPTVSLIAFQNDYSPNFFLQPGDANLDVNKVNSFFIYNNPYIAPSSLNSQTNAGYDLKFKSMDTIEVLLNVPGLPIYWGRNNNKIYIAGMPDQKYQLYMRYQKQHPFSKPVIGADPILMADSWQDIAEFAAALRCAQEINLASKVTELHARLYGDQKFQTSGGIEGAPGLIFQRTSQRNRDQSTTVRRLRLRMGNVG